MCYEGGSYNVCKTNTAKGIDMKKTGLNGSADLLANAIRNSQKEIADEAVKGIAELMESNKKEILKASKEDTEKSLQKMEKRLRKGLEQDMHKHMGMYTRKHESRITKLERKLEGK